MPKGVSVRLPGLTIAIPAYNEEENLPMVLRDTLKDAPKFLSDFEIVVIDDGSTDSTGTIADRFAKKYPQIRVIHQSNGGYGVAMLRGIKEAKKTFVAYMPADGQFLVRDMQYCLPHMMTADVILGVRGRRVDYTTYRLILSYGYLFFLRLFYGLAYHDVNWLTIWRTKIVQRLPIASRGVFMLAEIVIRCKKNRLHVVEAPSAYRSRMGGRAKNARLSVALSTLYDAIRLWYVLHF